MHPCTIALKPLCVFRSAWEKYEHSNYNDCESWFDLIHAHSRLTLRQVEDLYGLWDENGDGCVRKCYRRDIGSSCYVYTFMKNGYEFSTKDTSILVKL